MKESYIFEEFPLVIPLKLRTSGTLFFVIIGSLFTLMTVPFLFHPETPLVVTLGFFIALGFTFAPLIFKCTNNEIIIDSEFLQINYIGRKISILWKELISVSSTTHKSSDYLVIKYRNEKRKVKDLSFPKGLLPKNREEEVTDILYHYQKYRTRKFLQERFAERKQANQFYKEKVQNETLWGLIGVLLGAVPLIIIVIFALLTDY